MLDYRGVGLKRFHCGCRSTACKSVLFVDLELLEGIELFWVLKPSTLICAENNLVCFGTSVQLLFLQIQLVSPALAVS